MRFSIKEARLKNELTLREFAENLGVSRQAVFNYENGVNCPTEEVFEKMKKLLNLKGKYEDWFVVKPIAKYTDKDVCLKEGCKKRPASKGYCMTHYLVLWKKAKVQKQKENDDVQKDLETTIQ